MTLPGDPLIRRALDTQVRSGPGASSFFSAPSRELDPALFVGEQLNPEVRRWVLHTLYSYWSHRYANPTTWSRVWIAGSGVTYQWSAGREAFGAPGDLDVLIGVDWPGFFIANPRWSGTSYVDMAAQFNEEFFQLLAPRTAQQNINGTVFEVTWYVNPTATDIRTIHPYAAYDVTDDSWTVRPPDLPADWDPRRSLSSTWWDAFNREASEAHDIYRDYRNTVSALRLSVVQAHQVSLGAQLHHILSRANDWWTSVHSERRKAFAPGGSGYADYYNVRWQAHKLDGSGSIIKQLVGVWAEAHKDLAASCYGTDIPDAAHSLATAAAAVRAGN